MTNFSVPQGPKGDAGGPALDETKQDTSPLWGLFVLGVILLAIAPWLTPWAVAGKLAVDGALLVASAVVGYVSTLEAEENDCNCF